MKPLARVLTLLAATSFAAAPLLAQNVPDKAGKLVKKDAKAEPAKKPPAKKSPLPKKKGVLAPTIEKQQKK
jgi:hypothetical protein